MAQWPVKKVMKLRCDVPTCGSTPKTAAKNARFGLKRSEIKAFGMPKSFKTRGSGTLGDSLGDALDLLYNAKQNCILAVPSSGGASQLALDRFLYGRKGQDWVMCKAHACEAVA